MVKRSDGQEHTLESDISAQTHDFTITFFSQPQTFQSMTDYQVKDYSFQLCVLLNAHIIGWESDLRNAPNDKVSQL